MGVGSENKHSWYEPYQVGSNLRGRLRPMDGVVQISNIEPPLSPLTSGIQDSWHPLFSIMHEEEEGEVVVEAGQ